MDFFFQPPTNLLLAALFSAVAVGSARRGTRLFLRGLRTADHPSGALWVVRGIRGCVVAVSMGVLSGGVLYAETWLLVFGTIFLGEELYETGVVSLALGVGVRPCDKPGQAPRVRA